tara:strand:+ start:1507 stop:2208 length:702 start_codon:yes stop_codon:yes gene_type:complete
MTKKAIFLFDYTGIMAAPWVSAGFECWCFDGQHEPGVTREGLLVKVGMWFDPYDVAGDVKKIKEVVGGNVVFVFGFPECTHLAVSGAAHFKRKAEANPNFQWEAMQLVYLCRDLGESYTVQWALENPVSVISSKWRKPNYIFNPFDYGGYLPENDAHPTYPDFIRPRDAYPNKTCIWSGGGFIMPEKAPVFCEPGYSDQHNRLGGKSLKTKNIRSATPRGFAMAVFASNFQGA